MSSTKNAALLPLIAEEGSNEHVVSVNPLELPLTGRYVAVMIPLPVATGMYMMASMTVTTAVNKNVFLCEQTFTIF